MYRCLELAKRGAGYVAPNPMVGAVLVHNFKIIGEGWHKKFGEAHAEVNCIASVKAEDKDLVAQAVLYVSLEPCAHFGKTPPCTDLIIKNKIPKVIIGCRDPFSVVDGKGIEKLIAADIEVVTGILEEECIELNKRFFTFQTKQRPYIILKWAQSADGKMASKILPHRQANHLNKVTDNNSISSRLIISNEYSNRLVHRWRSEEASILVGTNTAMMDNPELTTRLWPGPSPIRLVVDIDLKLPSYLKIFNQQVHTIVFNDIKNEEKKNLHYYRISKEGSLVSRLLLAFYQLKIQSVLVEGGAKLLQSFIDEELWDEVRIIKNSEFVIHNGLDAPVLKNAEKVVEQKLFTDKIELYRSKHS